MPKVWNKRDPNTPRNAVYIGRPSVFGNPFTHIRDKKTLAGFIVNSRDEAVEMFEKFALEQPEFIALIKKELKNKDLVCWCAPERCHGDFLIRIANK